MSTSHGKQGGAAPLHWGNLGHVRFWLQVLLLPAFLGGVASLLWEPLGYLVFWVALPLVFVAGLMAPALSCPRCGKRVKAGYAVCHHCGYDQNA